MTCGYFSVSAMRSCVRPASATTSPRMFGKVCGGKIVAISLSRSLAVLRHADGGGESRRRACARSRRKSGSSIAPRISRTRSARKLKHSTPSPSLHAAIVADHRRHDELVELLAAHRRRRSAACASAKRGPSAVDDGVVGLARRAPSACRGPSRSSARSRSRSAPPAAARRRSAARSSPADCGGVSRPSVKACTTAGTPASVEDLRQRRRA